MTAASPWAALAAPVPPPEWGGPARLVALLSSKDEPADSPNERRAAAVSRARRAARPDLRALQQLQLRAQAAVLQVAPAWSLIEPGSPREALMRQAPASWWWPLLDD